MSRAVRKTSRHVNVINQCAEINQRERIDPAIGIK